MVRVLGCPTRCQRSRVDCASRAGLDAYAGNVVEGDVDGCAAQHPSDRKSKCGDDREELRQHQSPSPGDLMDARITVATDGWSFRGPRWGTQPWRLISPRYGRATSPATTWAFADSIFATKAGDSPALSCTISKAMR
jgi:hypothetical protein